jgi:hypothetical protein
MRTFSAYQQVVGEVQRGAIIPSGAWQEWGSVRFIAEARPHGRIVFALADVGYRQSGLAYDPTGGVLAADPVDVSLGDPRHHIGNATVQNCHSALVTAYYRCDVWVLGDD